MSPFRRSSPYRASTDAVWVFVVGFSALAMHACGGGGGGGGPRPPSGLSYAIASPSYDICAPIAANAPTLTAGTATQFSIAPSLPPGLSMAPNTGVISGAPSALLAPTTFTVTASNSAGSASADLVIEVVTADPNGLDYGAPTLPFAFGVESRYAPTLASGFAGTWSVIAGALPSGLALDSVTGEIVGTPPLALAASNTAVTIRATNCVGASTQVALTVAVDFPVARGAFVLNDAEPVLSNYSFEASSGLLRSHGTTLTTDAASGELAVTHDGKWLIVGEGDFAALRTFACSLTSPSVTDTGFVVSCGTMPALALAVHPSSEFVYAITGDGHVAQFALDGASGELTALSPATVAVGDEPSALAVDPLGRFVFVTRALDAQVASFTVDLGTGRLTHVGDVATGAQPSSIAVAPGGAFAYVANAGDGSISGYSIHPSSGALFPLAGSPFTTPGGTSPAALAVAPNGAHLYAAHSFSAAIDGFALQPGGAPISLSTPTTATERPLSRLVIEPSGGHLFALSEGLGWLSFERGGDGLLHPSDNARIVGRGASRALAFQPAVQSFSFASENAYAAGVDGRLYQFSVAPTGVLAALTPPSVVASASALSWVDVHPVLGSVATISPTASPTLLAPDSNGALELEVAGTQRPGSRSIHFDLSGRFAYEVIDRVPAEIQAYSVDPLTSMMTPLAAAEVSDGPRELALHPNGRFVYVPCESADTIDMLEIDWATGELIPTSITLTGSAPRQIAIVDSGALLLCLEADTATMVVYKIDALGGLLEPMAGSFNAVGLGATGFAVPSSATHVFVAGAAGFALRVFTLDANDGTMFATGQTLGGSVLQSLRVEPNGRSIYAARGASSLARITYDATTGLSLAQTIAGGPTPASVALRNVLR